MRVPACWGSWRGTNSGTPGQRHSLPGGGAGVGHGRGVLCVRVHGFVLQVSGSAQKFLLVSKVSSLLSFAFFVLLIISQYLDLLLL